MTVWLGLGYKNTWLGLGKNHVWVKIDPFAMVTVCKKRLTPLMCVLFQSCLKLQRNYITIVHPVGPMIGQLQQWSLSNIIYDAGTRTQRYQMV